MEDNLVWTSTGKETEEKSTRKKVKDQDGTEVVNTFSFAKSAAMVSIDLYLRVWNDARTALTIIHDLPYCKKLVWNIVVLTRLSLLVYFIVNLHQFI